MAKKQRNNWQTLLDLVSTDDGLPVRESGHWAEDKLHYWNHYISITTTAMVGKPAWEAGVVYIDLFCGPGVCVERNSRKRFPGSPLIAAYAPKAFTKILLCELNPENSDACRKRMDATPACERYALFNGDCNTKIDEIIPHIPQRSLALAFLDPTGLHVHFETVKKLADRGRTDLLILFPDAVDIVRNDKTVYFDQPESNLDLVLGPESNWRKKVSELNSNEVTKKKRLYADIYLDQLRDKCNFDYFGEVVIKKGTLPLYRLVYATKHPKGLEFWEKSIKRDSQGQGQLF